MPDSLTDRFMERIKATIAADLTRFQSAGLPPRAQVEKLMEIPI